MFLFNPAQGLLIHQPILWLNLKREFFSDSSHLILARQIPHSRGSYINVALKAGLVVTGNSELYRLEPRFPNAKTAFLQESPNEVRSTQLAVFEVID